jgi:hypothetical protein
LGVAGVEAAAELGLLALGEVFDAVAEQPADLVERVVFVATPAERVLLDAAADFVDDLGAEPDHVGGIQHGDRVREAVADRVRIPPKRIRAAVSHAVDELVGLAFSQAL